MSDGSVLGGVSGLELSSETGSMAASEHLPEARRAACGDPAVLEASEDPPLSATVSLQRTASGMPEMEGEVSEVPFTDLFGPALLRPTLLISLTWLMLSFGQYLSQLLLIPPATAAIAATAAAAISTTTAALECLVLNSLPC